MEDLLQKAGSQAVTFAIRSGISIASGYAFRSLSKFLDKLPEGDKLSLKETKKRLETKIQIITPAIDLIALIAARGNTSLDSTLELTNDLKEDIDEYDKKIDDINRLIESVGYRKPQQSHVELNKVEKSTKELLARIEEAIPLISLALTTSGANLSSSLPDSVSPGRLLQASNYLSIADSQFQLQIKSNSSSHPQPVQVGPTFTLVLYSIFHGTSITHSDTTWKEDYAKCKVSLWRVTGTGTDTGSRAGSGSRRYSNTDGIEYRYELKIKEDLDDGRYHEEGTVVRERTLDVSIFTRLFFSASGRLLDIEEANTPVLVLKLNSVFQTQQKTELHSRVTDEDDQFSRDGGAEWLAFELYNNEDEGSRSYEDDEDDVEEVDSFGDDDEESEEVNKDKNNSSINNISSQSISLINEMKNLTLNQTDPLLYPDSSKPSLSLLEYLIRLTALQTNDQTSIYNIQDERITLYLRDESGNSHSQSAAAAATTASSGSVLGNGDGDRSVFFRSPSSSPISTKLSPNNSSHSIRRHRRYISHSPSVLYSSKIQQRSPSTLHPNTKSLRHRPSNFPIASGTPQLPQTPGSSERSRQKRNESRVVSPSLTPWEIDRMQQNPILRRVIDDSNVDSPLRRKAAVNRNHK